MFSRYPEIFIGDSGNQEIFDDLAMRAIWLRNLLRRAWDATDQRHREWFVHETESYYHKLRADRDLGEQVGDRTMLREMLGGYLQLGDPIFDLRTVEPPAEPTPLEAALFYFKRNVNRARHCPNPDCPAAYFFAAKKGQKYCSEICAKPAQREAKLRWWHENRGNRTR
jgi:hypothetical protein